MQATALPTALALALTDGRCCPVVPDDYSGHLAVKDALKSLPTMLATAEHEYTRYGYKQLIDSGAVDVLQPDITWLGGITEVRFQPHRGSSGLRKPEERKIKIKINLDCVGLPMLRLYLPTVHY